MKALYLVIERCERFRTVTAADKECSRISHDARHVPNKFLRRSYLVSCLKICEIGLNTTQRLLGSIGQSGKEMSQ